DGRPAGPAQSLAARCAERRPGDRGAGRRPRGIGVQTPLWRQGCQQYNSRSWRCSRPRRWLDCRRSRRRRPHLFHGGQRVDMAVTEARRETGPRAKVKGPRSITILGSTGSIGCSTIDVVERYSDEYRVDALTAHSNVERLIEQALRLKPRFVAIGDAKL